MHNRKDFEIFRAREMRHTPTDAERKLWRLLRGKRFGVRFRRQQPVGPYVVDFYCSPARLVIELDGSQHGLEVLRRLDERRTQWLEAQGYRVLRFWNDEVFHHQESVLDRIILALVERGARLDPALEGGERS